MALVVVALAWLMSMAAVATWDAPWWITGACVAAASPLFVFGRGRGSWLLVVATALAALVGGWRFEEWQNRNSPDLARYVGGEVMVEGVIASEPDPGRTTTSYDVSVERVTRERATEPTGGNVRVTLGQYDEYLPGARVRLAGKLEDAPVFEDFDYRSYLARRGVVGTMLFPKVVITGQPSQWALERNLVRMRLSLERALQRSLPEPEASLGAGIAFGRDGNLPDDLYDDFRTTGLAHIVAVSGSNVTMVTALVFVAAVPLLGRRRALLPAGIAVVAYVAVAGFSPSVVRAGIMAGVFLTGAYLGRQQSGLAALGAAAIVMTGWSPGFLAPVGLAFGPQVAQDVGFQLSLAATAGLMVFGPWIRFALLTARQRWRTESLVPGTAVEVAALTLSATIATLPLMWSNFGQVSLVGVLANIVVEPLFVFAFVLSAAAAVAGIAWEPAGWAVGLVAYYPLSGITWFANTAADLPFAAVRTPDAGAESALVAYAAMALAGWPLYSRLAPSVSPRRWTRERTGRRVVAWSASAAAVAVFAVPISFLPMRGPGELEMTVLDIGQGDAILLTTPSGKHVLVDGGPSAIDLARELGAVLPHWQRTIDTVVVTHPQEDHVGGIAGLLARYHVHAERDSGAGNETTSVVLYEQRANHRQTVSAGEAFTLDGVSFEVLWPTGQYKTDQLNDRSVVLRVTYGAVSMLLTGDLEAPAESAMMAQADVAADVLKVPHHGSKTTSAAFLAAVDPAVAVISVGANNRFGHPAAETVAALAGTKVLRTDQDGRVTVRTDGRRIDVQTER